MNAARCIRALLTMVIVVVGAVAATTAVGGASASAAPCVTCGDGDGGGGSGGGGGTPTLPKMAQYSVSWSNFGSQTWPASKVAALVFTKAGFLGIHVGQYDLRNVAGRSGYVETFNWTSDS